ncbi:MAG TPA: SH3 domain-containing protein [Anaerolineales bacterium]|nr:SH3 domain-containing protein [Anaerolineales bacterium]
MKRSVYLFLLTSLLLTSCSMSSSDAPSPEVATAAAMTVQAAIEGNQTPLASPTSAGQSTPESTGNPMASFEDVTNCRVGPGVNYERVTQIQPGFAVEIVGYYPPNYWIVQTDKGPCWVAGEFVTPSGSVSAVPTVTAPPTPTGGAPENVSLQKWDVACDYATNEAKVTIAWKDEDDEIGYRVVRNDVVIAELPANTTEFKETITLISGQTAGYSIISFNATGSTQSQTISLGC